MLEHFARNWGNWASVAGLVFSILAFIFSKRASKAAEQARDSVLRRSLTQDMNDASGTAAEIVRFVGIERGDMALLRAGELLRQTSYYITRWDAKLAETSRANLRRAQDKLLSINKMLTSKTIGEMTPNQKLTLAQACQSASLVFSEEYGTATKATDEVH
jgi:hypothetical protein